MCVAEGCGKRIHFCCYETTVLAKHRKEPLDNDVPEEERDVCLVVCTKKCYEKAEKARNGAATGTALLWSKDGRQGPNDPMNSEAILIQWLATPGNYSRYKGKNNYGKKKIQFADDIAKRINDAGVRVKRDKERVKAKIEHIESSFKSAHDFSNTETGAGLKDNNEGTFKEIVLRKCPWYYDLLDIFNDRASAKAKMTSDELESDDEGVFGSDDDKDDANDGYDSDDDDNESNKGSVSDKENPSSDKENPSSDKENPSSDKENPSSDKENKDSTNSFATKKMRGGGIASRPLSVRKPKKTRTSGGDDDDVLGLGGNYKIWIDDLNEKKSKQLNEQKRQFDEKMRHHKIMEDSALRKAEILKESTKWKAKSDELEYKFNLIKRYNEIKSSMTKAEILDMFPEMEPLIKDPDEL
jgi:hypothetical protein